MTSQNSIHKGCFASGYLCVQVLRFNALLVLVGLHLDYPYRLNSQFENIITRKNWFLSPSGLGKRFMRQQLKNFFKCSTVLLGHSMPVSLFAAFTEYAEKLQYLYASISIKTAMYVLYYRPADTNLCRNSRSENSSNPTEESVFTKFGKKA